MITKTQTTWRDILPHYIDASLADSERYGATIGRVVQLDYLGVTWTVASDARHLVAVRGEHGGEPANEQGRKTLLSALEIKTGNGRLYSVADLKCFCGEPYSLEPTACHECGGSGREICPHCEREGDCDYCGGTGKRVRWPAAAPAIVNGVTVDKARLAHVLRLCEGDCHATRTDDATMLRLDGDGWVVLLMGLDVGKMATEGAIAEFQG